ncbi:MAG: hypothetical protein L3J04_07905, partial [Robiginitomaculum sp.]|nr:hypothetical protein [Robiginitomaculum sp.]
MLYFTENAIELASEELASSGTGMPQLDFSTFPSQIFWLAIAFGILYLALSRIFIPRIGGVLEERCDRIADDLDMAVSMKADADAAVIAYENSLKKAAERANSIAADNKSKISAEITEELEAQDNKINKVSNEVSVSNKQLNEILIRIKSINKNIDTKSKSIEKQRSQVISLLKFQVYLNHDKTLKMLLINPANSQTVQSKHVIKYLNHHLFNLIEEVARHIQQLETLKASQIILQQQENHKQQLLLV